MLGYDRDSAGDKFVDVADIRAFFLVAKRDRYALVSCPTGTSDTMHVGLRDIRDFVVDDMR